MMLSNIFLVLGASTALTSAALLKPGVVFYTESNWRHPENTRTFVPEDGQCYPLSAAYSGSMKMLTGGMECAIFSKWGCEKTKYWLASKFRHGLNDNTPKFLPDWMDKSGIDEGDRENINTWPVNSFMCRSYFNNLNEKDSSSNNVHVGHDGWHEPGEVYGGPDLIPPPGGSD